MRAFFVSCFACIALLLSGHARAEDAKQPQRSLRVDRCDEPADTNATATKTASQLYDRGLVLYEEGDYDGAIDAFVGSYCAKPHPAGFYNIAQSYERLLNFELSVIYFERYIAESDPAAPTTRKATLRAEVLRQLPAQIRVATVPAGATITIHDAAGLRARGKANQEAPLEVVQGSYTMQVHMPGYEDLTRNITTAPGQPYSYYLRLEALTGTLQVTATPGDSRIFLDDRLVGVGSYRETLPVGRYEVVLEAPGRESSKEFVTIKAGDTKEVSLELAAPAESGRRPLLIASALGLGVTGGVAMSSIFGQDSAETIASSLAAAAVGAGGAYYGIPESTTRGDAWFMIESSMIGAIEGALLGSFFACSVETVGSVQTKDCSDRENKAVTAAALSGGLLGLAGSAITHKRLKLTTGDAAVLGSAALIGLSSSALLYAVFDSDLRIRDPILFSGLNLGLVAGAGVLATNRISLERMAIIDLGGVGGVLGGALIAQAFKSGDERIQHFSIFGLVSGLVGATFLTRDMDEVGESTKGEPTRSDSRARSLTPVFGGTMDAAGNFVPNLGFSLRM